MFLSSLPGIVTNIVVFFVVIEYLEGYLVPFLGAELQ
jgi:hypothetical protein